MSNQRWRMGRGGNTVSKSIMFGFRKVKQIRWDAEWLAVRMELKWDVRVGMKQVWITGVGGDLPKAPRKTYYGKAFFPHQFSLYFNSIFHQLSEVSSINGQCAWCNFIGSLVQKEKKRNLGWLLGIANLEVRKRECSYGDWAVGPKAAMRSVTEWRCSDTSYPCRDLSVDSV